MTGITVKMVAEATQDEKFRLSFFESVEEKEQLYDFLRDDCFLCGLGSLIRTVLMKPDQKILGYFGEECAPWLSKFRKKEKQKNGI